MAKKLTTEEFIIKARSVHGDKYDYSKSKYIYARENIEIICNKHGAFWQRVTNHLSKSYGCSKCSGIRKSNKDEFIQKARLIHGNKHDYSRVEYINNRTKVEIVCKEHGTFSQKPNDHLNKYGCAGCSGNKKISTEEFIVKARLVHGDKYDYSKSEYKNSDTKVQIICTQHGPFLQTPDNHFQEKGCSRCTHVISKPEIEWLDKLAIPDDKDHRQVIIKINNKIYRVDGYSPKTNTVYEFDGDFFHGNQSLYKKEDINPVTKTTFGKLYEKTCNKHRQIKEAGYNLITIWESDWKTQCVTTDQS